MDIGILRRNTTMDIGFLWRNGIMDIGFFGILLVNLGLELNDFVLHAIS